MSGIRQYLLSLCAASAVCAVINTLFQSKGSIQKIIKLLTGMFIALCAISPLLNLERVSFETITDEISTTPAAVALGKSMASEYTNEFIKEQSAAYVLNKAATLDLNVDVEVILDNGTPPKPCSVILDGAASPYAKEIMSQYINDTLGIAKEDQLWN